MPTSARQKDLLILAKLADAWWVKSKPVFQVAKSFL